MRATLFSLLLTVAVTGVSAAPAAAEPAATAEPAVIELLAAIDASALAPERAVAVEGLRLASGLAVFHVERGTFFPAAPLAGRVVEAVFVGQARLEMEAPDAVEAHQLELFTGAASLAEAVTEAVLVVANDGASEAIFGRPTVTADAALAERAGQVFTAWRSSPVRRRLNVEGAMLQDALGDRLYQGYFAAWMRGGERGEVVYLVEPDAREQVTLGQFVPIDLSDKEKRRVERRLHKAQRRGRLMGLSADDLGTWDTWVSSSLRGPDGAPTPGAASFEPERYSLEVTLDSRELELSGRGRLDLVATTGGTRVVRLTLHSDLAVTSATALGGGVLPFRQSGEEVLVVLPSAPAAGELVALELAWGGKAIEKLETGAFQLVDTVRWHPHAGEIDRAAYEVTLRWPRRLDLVAAGRRVDGGEGGGEAWETRRLEVPTSAFGFEVGKFSFAERQVGDVRLRVALSPTAYRSQAGIQERLLDDVAAALGYFEEAFGPCPVGELTVVTTYRPYSQSLLGFVTLSRWMLGEVAWLAELLGLEDPRTVIAHEVAHQWWGHVVGWESYRDQWISEAMATYAALLFARHRLGRVPRSGPISGWSASLAASLDDGRPVESAGPLVLGERLFSSKGGDAYTAIVYKKGAVVLNTLAQAFGEEAFVTLLRRVAEVASHRAVSTDTFFSLLERLSGRDLDAFQAQFVTGTGLPEVYYDYRFERAEDGTWRIAGSARQRSPYHFRYRLVEVPGGLDVARQRVDHLEVAGSSLAVPLQVALYDPAKRGEGKRGDPDPRQVGNVLLQGRLWLEGETTAIELPVEHEPKELWLDRYREVFGSFFNAQRYPKRVLYNECHDHAAEGDGDAALESCRQALAAPVFSGPDYAGSPAVEEQKLDARLLDGWIEAFMARLHLDAGRTAEARLALERAEDLLAPRKRPWYRPHLSTLEARLAIREGDFDAAFRLLRRGVVKREEIDSTEGLMLLAIAAHATGHREELALALQQARAQGADVTLLAAAR